MYFLYFIYIRLKNVSYYKTTLECGAFDTGIVDRKYQQYIKATRIFVRENCLIESSVNCHQIFSFVLT